MEAPLYRPNAGIIIFNRQGKLLWCKRKTGDGWQFPQGGIDDGESPEQAIIRETYEEVGLKHEKIKIIRENDRWINYDVPKNKIPKYFSLNNRRFRGQTQKWFLAEFLGEDSDINLNMHSQIEFTEWTWSSYWHPVAKGVEFKRDAYREALKDLLPFYKNYLKSI
jgi:putative (di)nucleoside polyphosphate hydrolase